MYYYYCSSPFPFPGRRIKANQTKTFSFIVLGTVIPGIFVHRGLADFHENDTLKILSEKYFDYLENSIEGNSDRIKFIPVGKVLYHFDQKAKSGKFPGFSGSGELYRDAWHLNNVGRYIAGLTVFSQIFQIDPVGIPDFKSYHTSDKWPGDRELTSKQKEVIRRIISEVF